MIVWFFALFFFSFRFSFDFYKNVVFRLSFFRWELSTHKTLLFINQKRVTFNVRIQYERRHCTAPEFYYSINCCNNFFCVFALIWVVVEKLCARLLVCAFSFSSISISMCRFTFLFSSCRFSLAYSSPVIDVLCMLLVFFYFTSTHCAQTTHSRSRSSNSSNGNLYDV